MMDLMHENKELSEPLQKKREEQRELEDKLRSYTKDKMALKNLRAHHRQLDERIGEAKQEYRTTEDRYRKLEKERDDIYRRFQKAVRDIQRKAELGKNAVLEKKLETTSTDASRKLSGTSSARPSWVRMPFWRKSSRRHLPTLPESCQGHPAQGRVG